MNLKEKIEKDFKEAQKGSDSLRLSTLRMLSAAIHNKEIEKRTKLKGKIESLTDDEVLSVVSSEAKKRKEAIAEYEKANRQDLAEKERKELEILKQYLPEELSEEEIRKLVKEGIQKTGAKDLKDIGRLMGYLMSQIKGRADGALVKKIVDEELNKASNA